MSPSPDISVCLDCGWSEFMIPHSWLAAGWLHPLPALAVAEKKRLDSAAPVFA